METSLFWDAKEVDGTLDRVYNSDDFAAMFAGFWGNGLIPNASSCLWVEPIENTFAVVVNPGDAFVKGRFYKNDSDLQLTLTSGNGEERVDYVALRFDSPKRQVYLRVLEGAEGEGAPSFAQSDTLFDLLLARVTIPANAQYLTDEMVEDLRGTEVCPWVNLRFDLDAITHGFEQWYTDMRELLDEDVAVQLQEQIDKNESDITALNQSIANLVVQNQQLQAQLSNERRYDAVIKNNDLYVYARPYNASIDTGIP